MEVQDDIEVTTHIPDQVLSVSLLNNLFTLSPFLY